MKSLEGISLWMSKILIKIFNFKLLVGPLNKVEIVEKCWKPISGHRKQFYRHHHWKEVFIDSDFTSSA